MDTATAGTLAHLTSTFYEQVAPSFSATRQAPWQGWQRVIDEMETPHAHTLTVLDLACGNLRFERFLGEALASGRIAAQRAHVRALDCCDALVHDASPASVEVNYTHLDVAETLLAGADLGAYVGKGTFDLSVCFGFLHHLAMPEHRTRVLTALAQSLAPGGIAAVTFWQLSQSPRLLAKAQATTAQAAQALDLHGLATGDYLLGWQDRTDVLRYCHDFSEEEIDALADAVSPYARERARFSADGATGTLNRYLVLQTR